MVNFSIIDRKLGKQASALYDGVQEEEIFPTL